jgi:hypothetical protein
MNLTYKTHSQLVRLLDTEISQHVRMCAAITEGSEWITCYTCETRKPWQEMHAGHCITRTHWGTRFDLDNIRPQCPNCNLFHGGRQTRFAMLLASELGQTAWLNLTTNANSGERHERDYLVEQIGYYEIVNKELKRRMDDYGFQD